MLRWVLVLWMALLLGAASPAVALEPDIADGLRAVRGLTVVSDTAVANNGRFFALTFRQPADHLRPWLGSFEQRLHLLYYPGDRPTLLHTTGYNARTAQTPVELTRLIGGNQLNVEHRFFVPSRPDPADWTKLDIWQAATDHHRIVRALRPVLRGNWLSSGGSKGGMATVYHRRFYPWDVDGSVAFVAPNDVNDREDSAYDRFFQRVGTDPACRERLKAVQVEALGRRRAELLARLTAYAAANGYTFDKTLGSADRMLEFTVLDTAWTFWQVRGQPACPAVPAAPASADALWTFIDETIGWSGYTDQGNEPFIPYYFQAATQLGYPGPKFRHVRKLRRYPQIYSARSFVPRLFTRFDPWAMDDIDRWVRWASSELMFVYGENDPWSAERFEPGRWTRDTSLYVVPGATHSTSIAALPPEQRAEATATVLRWAGVPAATGIAPEAERQAAADADYEVIAGRP